MITSSFPYGESETFLETEFPYLEQSFDTIFIIHTEIRSDDSRINSESTHIHYLPYLPTREEKRKYYNLLFNKLVIRELAYLWSRQKRIPSLSILSSLLGSLTTGLKLKKLIAKLITQNKLWDHDLHAYTYWCNDMATGLALLKLEFPAINCISRAHGYDVYLERSTIDYLPFRKLIFSTLDRVSFISEHGKKYSVAKFGNHGSFTVSYLGVDQCKSTYPPNLSCWQIVSCSSVIPLKRLHLIVEALALFEKERIKWTHIGDGKLFSEIKDYASRLLGDKSNIEFNFVGRQSNQNILQAYSRHHFDLFINVSRHEGLPVSIMEAMAHGIPVIAPDVGGISEIVNDGSNGILIKARLSDVVLKIALKKFFNKSVEVKMAMSANAYTTWEKKFKAEVNYAKFVKDLLHV